MAGEPEYEDDAEMTAEQIIAQWHDLRAMQSDADVVFKIDLYASGQARMSAGGHTYDAVSASLATLLEGRHGGSTVIDPGILTVYGIVAPDVAWCSDHFMAEHADESPWRMAPELCIQVVFPGSDVTLLREKTSMFLSAGAIEGWIVNPDDRTIELYGAEGPGASSRFAVEAADVLAAVSMEGDGKPHRNDGETAQFIDRRGMEPALDEGEESPYTDADRIDFWRELNASPFETDGRPAKYEIHAGNGSYILGGRYHEPMLQPLAALLVARLGGATLLDAPPLMSEDNICTPDLAWCSNDYLATQDVDSPGRSAPELCILVYYARRDVDLVGNAGHCFLVTGAREVWLIHIDARGVQMNDRDGLLESSSFGISPEEIIECVFRAR